MTSIISEILKIQVDLSFTLASSTFAKLRAAAVKGGVKEQYYGLNMDKSDELFWIIHWPGDSKPTEFKGPEEDFREAVKALDVNKAPTSVYLPFDSANRVRPALIAPVCELCFVHITSAPNTPDLSHSLEKTFTDCYFAEGFTGGFWAEDLYDDKMNYYFLGWESRQLHLKYLKSELCDEEMNKLIPYMDGGSGYFVQKMTQELS